MKKRNLFLAIAACSIASIIRANSNDVETIILAQNPELKTLEAQSQASLQALRSEAALDGPEVEFEYLAAKNAENKWSAGVSQSFKWPGFYSAHNKVVAGKENMEDLWLRSRRADIFYEARQLMVRYASTLKRMDVLRNMISRFEELAEQLRTGLQHGLVTILDYKKSNIELTTLKASLNTMQEQLAQLEGQLTALAGRPLDWNELSLKTAATASLSLEPIESYMATAMEQDLTLQYIRQRDKVAILEAGTVNAGLMPSFTVGYRHSFEEGFHYNGFTVAVGLPSWNAGTIKKAAIAEQKATQAGISETVTNLSNRIRSDYSEASILRQSITAFRADGLDGEYLVLLADAYSGGELTVMDYISEQAYFLTKSIELQEMEERYALLLLSLNRY